MVADGGFGGPAKGSEEANCLHPSVKMVVDRRGVEPLTSAVQGPLIESSIVTGSPKRSLISRGIVRVLSQTGEPRPPAGGPGRAPVQRFLVVREAHCMSGDVGGIDRVRRLGRLDRGPRETDTDSDSGVGVTQLT